MLARTKANLFMIKKFSQNFIFFLPLVFLLISYTLCLFRPVDLAVQDIGRHLINGREILAGNFEVLYKNSYSYTAPQTKFINHHWLSGVIFYLIYQNFGIETLEVFNILILLTMFITFFRLLSKKSNLFIASILGLVAVLFFASRLEVRPEMFSYLFISLILNFIYDSEQKKKLESWQFFSILIIQLLWVNLHISFIFNFFILALWLAELINQKSKFKPTFIKKVLGLNLAVVTISFVNPNFINGVLEPFKIFADYGYPIAENKSLFFLKRVVNDNLIYPYLIISFSQVLAFIFTFKKQKVNLFELGLALCGLGLGLIAKRNIILFVLFSFPMFATNLKLFLKKINFTLSKSQIKTAFLSLSLISFFMTALLASGKLNRYVNPRIFRLGFSIKQFDGVNYFKSLNIKGNIFNNYDIGSLLVFSLYPQNKVFVDNRPEAYGKKFFEETYLPIQQNEETWQQAVEKYQFKAIIFGARDMTEWGQAFIKRRINDPDWEVVYQDPSVVVFLDNDLN